jgi:hypothetical protein
MKKALQITVFIVTVLLVGGYYLNSYFKQRTEEKVEAQRTENNKATSTSSAVEDVSRLVKDVSLSVVTIYGRQDSSSQRLPRGTGFFIGKNGILITNYHVIKDLIDPDVETFDGKMWPVNRTIMNDLSLDIAVIGAAIGKGAYKYLEFTSELPPVGKSIFVIGSPLGLEQTVSNGIVSAIRSLPSTHMGKLIQITAPISPGSSGSPVVDNAGKVIGIATLQSKVGQNLNFAIPGARIVPEVKPYLDIETMTFKQEQGKDAVNKAKEIVKSFHNLDSVEFLGPVWFDFCSTGTEEEFYTIYRTKTNKKDFNSELDIFSTRNSKVRNLYHEKIGHIPDVMTYKLQGENLFIWKTIEGSGAVLYFKILALRNDKIVEVANHDVFWPHTVGANLRKYDDELVVTTKKDAYKLVNDRGSVRFSKIQVRPPVMDGNVKKMVFKEAKNKIEISFEGKPLVFLEDKEAIPIGSGYIASETVKLERHDRIFMDDKVEGFVSEGSGFKVLMSDEMFDTLDFTYGLYYFLAPIKRGSAHFLVRHEWCWYKIPVLVE